MRVSIGGITRLYTDDAELYDIAFEWDIEEEVGWLLERLGSPRSVLEPGCGSGRMLEPLARSSFCITVTGTCALPGDAGNIHVAETLLTPCCEV